MIQAIQTSYKGYRFRSRLEARWAVFFDALGLKWAYEPEGFDLGEAGYYLPDFRVAYPDYGDTYFEVKGDMTAVTQSEWRKLLAFDEAKGLLILDGTPECRMYLPPRTWIAGYDGAPLPAPPYRLQPSLLETERCGVALWSYKKRGWWDEHHNFFTPQGFDHEGSAAISKAVDAARSARFEHGESGATN